MTPEMKKILTGALTIVVGIVLADLIKAMFVDDVVAKIRAKKESGAFEIL